MLSVAAVAHYFRFNFDCISVYVIIDCSAFDIMLYADLLTLPMLIKAPEIVILIIVKLPERLILYFQGFSLLILIFRCAFYPEKEDPDRYEILIPTTIFSIFFPSVELLVYITEDPTTSFADDDFPYLQIVCRFDIVYATR